MGYEKYDENESWWDDAIIYGAMAIWALGIGGVAGVIVAYGIY